MTYLYVTPLQCRPKPEICRLKPITCRPAQEHSRHEPVIDCRPEPPCVVTDIPKRESAWLETEGPRVRALPASLCCVLEQEH